MAEPQTPTKATQRTAVQSPGEEESEGGRGTTLEKTSCAQLKPSQGGTTYASQEQPSSIDVVQSAGQTVGLESPMLSLFQEILAKLHDQQAFNQELKVKLDDQQAFNEELKVKLDDQRASNEQMNEKVDGMQGQLKEIQRTQNAIVSVNPQALVALLDVPIVDFDRREEVRGAVLGEHGRGISTWSFFQHNGEFYIASCAHCAMGVKMIRTSNSNITDSFRVPGLVIDLCEAIYILPESEFGYVDRKYWHDVVAVKLKSLPSGVLPEHVPCWKVFTQDQRSMNQFRFSSVAGRSLTGPVTGSHCVFEEDPASSQRNADGPGWITFVLQSKEPGNSGTLMFRATKDGYCEPMGLFTGLRNRNHLSQSGPQPRGVIAPLPDFSKFQRFAPKRIALQTFQVDMGRRGMPDIVSYELGSKTGQYREMSKGAIRGSEENTFWLFIKRTQTKIYHPQVTSWSHNY